MTVPLEAARVPLPTEAGEFDVRAFETSGGFVYLALVRGEIGDGRSVLARLHSECLTGDVLGSRRCDCGIQLQISLRAIAAAGRGVLIYATGHEGRGIGLINKLRAYMLQDLGSDTVSANREMGLPVDGRDYADAAHVLRSVGVRSVRLMTNNPDKEAAVRAGGIDVEAVIPLPVSPHVRNRGYLRTKERHLGHSGLNGSRPPEPLVPVGPDDPAELLGDVRPPPGRPYVVVKYAQTLDGRIATASGDSKWISGDEERKLSHALRAACDAVLVGVGTVLADDPQLTVRMVPGASPMRVVLDSTLRLPARARVLDQAAWTVVVTTARSSPVRRMELQSQGVGLTVVPPGPGGGIDLRAALEKLRAMGVRSLLVEGGARVITSALSEGLADRLVVGIAPTLIGAGTEAVGDLGIDTIGQGLRLSNRSVRRVGDDILIAGDVRHDPAHPGLAGAPGAAQEDLRATARPDA
jgi:GTP cyclohydrolase II